MKKFLSIALVFVMVFTLAGCGGEDTLVGTWKLDGEALSASLEGADDDAAFAGALLAMMDYTMTFKADGTVEITMGAFGETETQNGTYKTEGSTLTISNEDGTTNSSNYRIEGGVLYFESEGLEMPFVRS